MRVLALVTDAFGGEGGIAQAARDVIAALASLPGVEAVEALPRHSVEAPLNLPARVSQRDPVPGRVAYAACSLAAASRLKPSLIFCNHLFMAPLARLVARFVGAKLAIQLHGLEIWQKPTVAQRAALEAADLLLCVSRDTRTRALTHACVAPERARVCANMVDSRFAPGDRLFARAKFCLGSEFVLLAVGRLDPRERYKGHDRLISTLSSLTGPGGRPVIFLIAGDGDDRTRLERLASATGVADRVRFLGKVPAEDLPDLYRSADLFVLPSTGEGFGIVFIEAMACGTAAFGLAVGGAPDALGDGILGTLVDPSADFAAALQATIAAPSPDTHAVAASVQARFGEAAFRQRLLNALSVMIDDRAR